MGTNNDKMIKIRVACPENSISERDIPADVVYATSNNIDRAAINDILFSLFNSKTHSKEKQGKIPCHQIFCL